MSKKLSMYRPQQLTHAAVCFTAMLDLVFLSQKLPLFVMHLVLHLLMFSSIVKMTDAFFFFLINTIECDMHLYLAYLS